MLTIPLEFSFGIKIHIPIPQILFIASVFLLTPTFWTEKNSLKCMISNLSPGTKSRKCVTTGILNHCVEFYSPCRAPRHPGCSAVNAAPHSDQFERVRGTKSKVKTEVSRILHHVLDTQGLQSPNLLESVHPWYLIEPTRNWEIRASTFDDFQFFALDLSSRGVWTKVQCFCLSHLLSIQKEPLSMYFD